MRKLGERLPLRRKKKGKKLASGKGECFISDGRGLNCASEDTPRTGGRGSYGPVQRNILFSSKKF